MMRRTVLVSVLVVGGIVASLASPAEVGAWETPAARAGHVALADRYKAAAAAVPDPGSPEVKYYKQCEETLREVIDIEDRKDYDASNGKLYQEAFAAKLKELREKLLKLKCRYHAGSKRAPQQQIRAAYELYATTAVFEKVAPTMGKSLGGNIEECAWILRGEVNPPNPKGKCRSQAQYLANEMSAIGPLQQFVLVPWNIGWVGGSFPHAAVGLRDVVTGQVVWVLDPFFGISAPAWEWELIMVRDHGYLSTPSESRIPFDGQQ